VTPKDEPPSETAIRDNPETATPIIHMIDESGDEKDRYAIPTDMILDEIRDYRDFMEDDTKTSELTLRQVVESDQYGRDCGEALEGNISAEWNVHSGKAKTRIFLIHLAIAWYRNYGYAYLLSFANFQVHFGREETYGKPTIPSTFTTV
jgi:hypothetical protein